MPSGWLRQPRRHDVRPTSRPRRRSRAMRGAAAPTTARDPSGHRPATDSGWGVPVHYTPGVAAGRGVVASAPALGAGDRRFESCRPDRCDSHPGTEEHPHREERRRDPEPDPGQADRRGPVRGAQAEPRRCVPEDRQADPGAGLPQGQGPPDRRRPAHRPRGRARRGRQRRAAEDVRAGAAGQRPAPAQPARRRRHQLLRRRGAGVHRRGRHPARDHAARLRGAQASVADLEVTDDEVEEQLQGLRERFGTLNDVEAPRRRGRPRDDRPGRLRRG